MAKYKKKRFSFKSLLSLVLVIGTVVALGAGVTALAKEDSRTVNKLNLFEVGSVSTETGEYIESKTALVTKTLIECQGLSITPSFENKVKFQIFWYNMDEIYFDCTEVLSKKFVASDVPDCATYCRIVVFPSTLDENGKEIKDFKIKFYEVLKYVSDLKIEVNKKQDAPIDYYEIAMDSMAPERYVPVSIDEPYLFYQNKWIYVVNRNFVDDMTDYLTSEHHTIKVKCDDWSEYMITFNDTYDGQNEVYVRFFDADGTCVGDTVAHGYKGETHVASVPENASYACFGVYSISNPIIINKYMPR